MANGDPVREREGQAMTGCRSRSWRGGDGGSATPVILAMLAVVVIVSMAAVHAGAVIVAEAQAEAAADLAALAAARVDRDSRAQGMPPGAALRSGCEAALDVASRNGATSITCVRGQRMSVDVTVEIPMRAWPLPLQASARAGPVMSGRARK